jgi:hypothetical protein
LIIGKSLKTPDVQEILNNPELEGVISNAITFNQIGNLQAQAIHDRIMEILDILNEEIHESG